MADKSYAFQGFEKDLMARAQGRDLDISTKQAIEICNFLRNMKLSRAKQALKNVIIMKEAIPFKRFTNGVGHRKGDLAAGRFPKKASQRVLALLESVEANAQSKGLNTSDLEIIHICANMAHRPMHQGRQSRRAFKRTHVEVVVKETTSKEKKAKARSKAKPAQPKPEPKPESKPEPKNEEPKPESKKEETKKDEAKPAPRSESKPAQADKKENPKEEKPEASR